MGLEGTADHREAGIEVHGMMLVDTLELPMRRHPTDGLVEHRQLTAAQAC